MTLHQNSPQWQAERKLLDFLALLADIEDRRKVILRHAWEEKSWDAVFDEARRMELPLHSLRKEIQEHYSEIRAIITGLNGA